MTTKYLGEGVWARRTNIDSADIMMPIEIQGHHAEPIQTHNAVSISADSWSYGEWIHADGFDKVGANVNMTSGTGMAVTVQSSFDGSTLHGAKSVYNGSSNVVSEETPITAPYIRLAVKNTGTASKTTTAHAYLKA